MLSARWRPLDSCLDPAWSRDPADTCCWATVDQRHRPCVAAELQLTTLDTCPEGADAVGEAARRRDTAAASRVRRAAHFDDRGELTGAAWASRRQMVASSRSSCPSSRSSPRHSVTRSSTRSPAWTARRSTLIDLASGCDSLLAQPAAIVRSALLDPSGAALFVHASRRRAGATTASFRLPLDGSVAERVVPPLADG